MRCPFCDHPRDRVVDSRESQQGQVIRRRRQCSACKRRFTTYERVEDIPYMVVKKGGQRERFDRGKMLQGLLKACEKRPVSPQQLEAIVNRVEQELAEAGDHEITSEQIGQIVMTELKKIDKVAYVRFASVYLDFKDIGEFMAELNHLVKTR